MISFRSSHLAVPLSLAALLFASHASAQSEHVAPATEFAKSVVVKWISDPAVIAAIKAQNAKHAALSEDEIIKLDKQWRAEVDAGDKPLISAVLGNDVSKFLTAKKEEAGGAVTEIFVMDNKGLNVGQSDVTSDYWQGDEGKWQKTFLAGPDAIFVDEVEKDESTQMLQTQVSVSIKDPATNEAIGAITVGLSIEML